MRASLPILAVLVVSCATPPAPPPSSTPAPPKASASKPAAPIVVRRTVVSLSRPSGSCVTTFGSDGTITSALDVLANGRGPKVDATLKVGPDGTLSSFVAKGHHTFGTAVDETFARTGDHAEWKSVEEEGARDVKGSAFFLPVAEVPEVYGLLARALVKAGGTLPLLPGGTATLERDGEITVQGRHLVGYSIHGLELTPQHVWMNDDGTWFGFASPWFSVVPEGFEGAIEPLIETQHAIDRARDEALAKRLAHRPPPEGVAYVHARVLDVEKGAWLPDRTVVVVGDRITAIGKGLKPPKGAEVIDLAGKALLPGLWDMHAHLGDADGVLNVASGVTTARDVGNDPDELDDRKNRFDAGEAIGPRVLRFGFIEGRNPKAAPSKVTAETPEEAKAAVETYAKRGYEGIKIYNSVKPELVPILAKEAHARGMAVTGHVPVHMLANEAIRAGYDGIEHINMLFLNFFATHDTDTRDTTRFTLVGEKAPGFDLASKELAGFMDLLAKRDTLIDPTLDAFEDLFVGRQGKITHGLESLVERLPVQAQRQFLLGGLPADDEATIETYREAYEQLLAMTKRLWERHIRLLIGTDALAGLMLHHEMALFVRAGIPTKDVLAIATIRAAKAMKLEKKSGSIAVGKDADLVVIDGDPLATITDVGKVVSTMRGGVIYPSAPLYEAIGVRPSGK